MKIFLKPFIFIVPVLLSSLLSEAQELPSLPSDPAVTHGVLPDNLEYYLVSNPTEKGTADFSLVWRLGKPADTDTSFACSITASLSVSEAVDVAREGLAATSLFSSRTPGAFLRDNGIQGASCGYVETRDNAVLLRFSGVDMSRSAVVDSLLLLTFDLARTYSGTVKEMVAEDCGQAIIIAGDIDKDAIVSKMKMLSLFVPDTGAKKPESNYKWYPGDSLSCFCIQDSTAGLATVFAEYSMPRVPEKYMSTVLPVVSGQLGEELGMILKKRLEKTLRTLEIPVADIRYRFSGSSEWSGDEKYTLSVRTAPDNVENVVPVISSVLSGLSGSGASVSEYAEARKVIGRQLKRRSESFVKSNGTYTERCISAFLYGSSLASSAERYKFFESSGLEDSSGLRFFNRFSSSLIDSTKNMSLACVSPGDTMSSQELEELFEKGWSEPVQASGSYAVDYNDTSLFNIEPVKCRLSRNRTENMSGGWLWTFSNGMKVVYKHIPAGGKFWYSMIMRGGFSSVDGLVPGQGAFFSDMLGLYEIFGLRHDDFSYLLSAKDIVMQQEVDPYDMMIYGSAPAESLEFLLKALCGMATGRRMDPETFDYWKACEEQRLEAVSGLREDRMAVIDSILCLGSEYSMIKSRQGLAPGLQSVADSYFRTQFSKMNDGILVLVGDLDEFHLRKLLPEYLGSFPVTRKLPPRTRQSHQTVSGESTYIVDGDISSLDVVMSASIEFSISDYMASRIATMVLKDAVTPALDGMAARVEVYGRFNTAPSERLGVLISVESCDTSCFAAGSTALKPVRALFSIRSILERLSSENIDQAALDTYKAALKNDIESHQNDPAYWVDALTLRYTYGKDLHTDWSARIDEVTADSVREIISSLDGGGKVEYIVRPSDRK